MEAHVDECVQRRHMWRRHIWRSVQWTWRSVRQTWRSVCGGEPRGGACAAEAHVVKAQAVELCCGCHAGMFLPRASLRVSMAAVVPIPVSLISGVACPCTTSLPDTPRSVHLSTFSETCLDGAKSSLSLKAATGLVCGCVRSWAASLSCPPLLCLLIQQEDKSGAEAPTCFCPIALQPPLLSPPSDH